jgi:hypothetical protein
MLAFAAVASVVWSSALPAFADVGPPAPSAPAARPAPAAPSAASGPRVAPAPLGAPAPREAPAPAAAGRRKKGPELQLATGPGAFGSSWRGDSALAESFKLGFRFADLVTIDALTRLGYANVDERVLTYISLGSTIYARIGRVRPWARLALVHQHEEPTSAVRDDPFGAVFGVGNGIRHRGGFGSSLGVDVPVYTDKSAEFVLGAEATGTWFPDPRGPAIYYGGSLWAGLNYEL